MNVVVKNWIQRIQRFVSQSPSLLPGVATAVLSVGMWQLGAWRPSEYRVYNTLFQIRQLSGLSPISWDDRVAVIAIDESSLKKYGQIPWSRDRYVQLLTALSKSPPAVIGFDILFVDPSPVDADFANAIAANGNVILASAWDKQGQPLEIVPQLDAVALGEGQIWHNADVDGISRQAAVSFGRKPALGLAMLQAAARKDQESGRLRNGGIRREFQAPILNSPTKIALPQLIEDNKRQDVWINWPGRVQDSQTYSFADVVEGKIAKDALKGKFVLVGATATGLDPMRTPLNQSPPTAGVYLHAALIDNLLNNRLLQTPPQLVVILLLLGVGPLTSWLLSGQQLGRRIIIAFLLPSGWILLSIGAFIQGNWWLPVAAPVGTMLIAGVGVQLREQYEKQQLMSLFAKHVSPETADLLWQRKEEILEDGQLQAQEMTATVLFADIRGFTSISEKLQPRDLLSWLNRYFTAMTDCVMDHGGMIDKYIGDAIMAVFGIPFAHTDPEAIRQDALNAIAAAIAMQEKLEELNQIFTAEGKPTIRIGIGIHTGPVVAGSVGGARRLNYSVMGDTVNIAARLEPMNKQVQGENPYNIITTRKTFAYVCDHYPARPVGELQLRGREEATMIYCIQEPNSSSQVGTKTMLSIGNH